MHTPWQAAASRSSEAKESRPLTGNEAIARGAWEAGVRVAAAYPGTPSTEILESLANYPAEDLHAQWSTNEKVALDVAIGASFAGSRALCRDEACRPQRRRRRLHVADLYRRERRPGAGGLRRSRHPQLAERAGHAHLRASSPACRCWSRATRRKRSISPGWPSICPNSSTPPVIVRSTTRLSHTRSAVAVGARTEQPSRGFLERPARRT